jgi:hypothetical protein
VSTEEFVEKVIGGMDDFKAKTGEDVVMILLNKYWPVTAIAGVTVKVDAWSPHDCIFFDKTGLEEFEENQKYFNSKPLEFKNE